MRISDWSSDVCSSDLFEDARQMRLHDPKTGELFVTLDTLPPWHSTPHTVEVRERAMIYLKKAGLLHESLVDGIEAYHEHTRKQVVANKISANCYIKAGVTNTPSKPTLRKPAAQDPTTHTPTTGIPEQPR